ncbi:multi-sensor signal transduction histidine kinase [Haloterrigena turkmenica DSM 5511]|uniref:histidine kinase n=1 Tax=Haloterrigena turkmenica (strain ATCC 51198 / DSM 5511 / JCM 9101 / NCIMB 13204 / VKM B-1734 / 4k) TaxID=543526 RepID=D2RVW7_HALTV|nr:histidine kinase N-terminal 7TM domain-containing protein [Haloterrigena turkmenica]ADB61396.1 multi-sensor signal transduction histidine kinase [Haloterrigena turkmenica DSM 5511]
MESTDVLVPIIYAVATVIAAVLGGVIWRHREKTGAVPLVVAMAGAVIWAGSLFARSAVDHVSLSVFFLRFLYVGVGASVLGSFLFVLAYTGREHLLTRRTIALLSIEPVLLVAFAFANPGNLFFESIFRDPTVVGGIGFQWGPAFDVHLVYSYCLSLAGTILILEFLHNSRSLYRGQAAMLVGASTSPLLTNVVYTLDVLGSIDIDTTPIGFIVAGALYSVAIVRYRLVDIAPIARDRVLDTVTDGVFVVDTENRLIDVNPAGRALLEEFDESPIGTDLGSLFADRPELRDEFRGLRDRPVETERELALRDGHFHVRTTPIEDGRDRHVGWLFVVRDITERKRREAELQRQNERLERFADLVSHDLRNPLNVADGYLELARETDDEEYLDEIERSHDRMATIIDDVLALAREGADVTDPEPVALEDVTERAWNGVDTGAASLAIDTDASILADPERITRLLENLFRNSLEHGAERADGADLEVAVGTLGNSGDGSAAGFYVADDGDGIPSSQRGRVFEGGYTTDEDGTGFGLAIVAEIATAHDWTSAVAESDAGGARFEFRGVEPAGDATPADAEIESTESPLRSDPSQP